MSAYHQPQPSSSVPVPGYHCLADRVQRLEDALRDTEKSGELPPPRALQLDGINGYCPSVLHNKPHGHCWACARVSCTSVACDHMACQTPARFS